MTDIVSPQTREPGDLTLKRFANQAAKGNAMGAYGSYDPTGAANVNNGLRALPPVSEYRPGQYLSGPIARKTISGLASGLNAAKKIPAAELGNPNALAVRPSPGPLAVTGGNPNALAVRPSPGPLAVTGGGNPNALAVRPSPGLPATTGGEVAPAGKVVGLSPLGRTALGLGIGVADHYTPRASDETYAGQVVNNLRDSAVRMGTGYAMGGPLGAVGGGVYDLGRKFYDAGKEAYDYAKGAIQRPDLQAQREMQAGALNHPNNPPEAPHLPEVSVPASLSVTPNAGIMNGIQTPHPTATSQITPLNGISNGMPVAPGIVNNPAPVGQPATGNGFHMPSQEEMARFRKETGTRFDSHSVNDKLSLERMRGGEETFNSKQANAYRAANPNYRPGSYSSNPTPFAPPMPSAQPTAPAPAATPAAPATKPNPYSMEEYNRKKAASMAGTYGSGVSNSYNGLR